MPQPSSPGIQGLQRPQDSANQFNAITFLVQSLLSKLATAMPVKVIACTNSGGLSPVGTVDIQPLVNQIDGDGNAVAHGVIYGCPYMRLQGGANAVICDPQPGDVGIAVFASRDISSVIAQRGGPANPGSRRRFNWADGLYIGGVLNGVPTQYVEFAPGGITVHSPTLVKLSAPDVQISCTTLEIAASASVTINTPTLTINGNQTLNGNQHTTGSNTTDGVLSQGGKDVGAAHEHSGVQTGGGHTGGVV